MVSNQNFEVKCSDLKVNEIITKLLSYSKKSINNDNIKDDDFNNFNIDLNLLIEDLEVVITDCRQRGWDILKNRIEIQCKNCNLASFIWITQSLRMLLINKYGKNQKIENVKCEFIQFYNYYDGKDAHGVNRYTLKNFYFSHLLNIFEPFIHPEQIEKDPESVKVFNTLKEILNSNKDLKCDFYEVQYKSPRYGLHKGEKYAEGHVGKIENCLGSEIAKITYEIESSYEKLDEESEENEEDEEDEENEENEE